MNSAFLNKIEQENVEDMQVVEALALAHALEEAVQYIELDSSVAEQCEDYFSENRDLMPYQVRQTSWQKRDGLITLSVSATTSCFLVNLSENINF